MTGLFEMLYTPPNKICVIGEMLSFITQQIAEVTSNWGLLQVGKSFRNRTLASLIKTRRNEI